MMHAKKHALLWLAGGLIFSLLAFWIVISGLSGNVMVTDPDLIRNTTDSVMTNLQSGNWSSLSKATVGCPSLAPAIGEEDSPEQIIYGAYLNSLEWTFPEAFHIQGTQVTQRISVTHLDILQLTDTLSQILSEETASGPEDQMQILCSAVEQLLASDPPYTQQELTLTFLWENHQWCLLPDSAFLALLSGFVSH